jgi:hypothetical protein
VTIPSTLQPGQGFFIGWTGNTACVSFNGIMYFTVSAATAPPGPALGPTGPEVDPDCQKKNFWGKDAAQRAELRRLAELFYLNAWDGQKLAEDLDLLGLLLKALAAQEGVATDAAQGLIDKAGDLVEDEGTLRNRQADLELERRLLATDMKSAAKRMREASEAMTRIQKKLSEVKPKHGNKEGYKRRKRQLDAAHDAFNAASADFARAEGAFIRNRHQLKKVKLDVKRLRANLGDTLTKLSRFLTDTDIGRALGNFLRVFNAAQDAAAGWMVANAAIAAILNNLARPPQGCDENWTRKLPVPTNPGIPSRPSAATTAASAGPGAFGRLRPGIFLPRVQANAFNALLGALGEEIRLARELAADSAGTKSKPSRASLRKLGRVAAKTPGQFRRLASALSFDPLIATPEALAQREHGATVRALRAELRRLGGGRDLMGGLALVRGVSSVGTLVDPFARLRSPELDDLARRGAAALAR